MTSLILEREYLDRGTNGHIFWEPHHLPLVRTIELPWLDNKPGISCIPEGTYNLKLRYSRKFKTHILIEGVENRKLILFHPANNALEELRGCIAPVHRLTGEGKGYASKKACTRLLEFVTYFLKEEPVLLTIKNAK